MIAKRKDDMNSSKLTCILLLTATLAHACQVPVFRYALERWEPGRYRVRVPAKVEVDPLANAAVESAAEVTQIELYFPPKLRQAATTPIWTAPMSQENVQRALDSPLRRELSRRLLAGQSAVWVLLESGDAAKDDAAAKAIAAGIVAAQDKLKLPDGVITQDEANDPQKRRENADVLQSELPLEIAFSTLRLSRQNAAEAALIAMLMHLEPDLGDYATEPMVFPVFGRGRALEPMIGKGIHADNLLEAAAYLCGACSCEIKEQNPGIDLLMTADWAPVASREVVETVQFVPDPVEPPKPEAKTLQRVVLISMAAALLLKGWLISRRVLQRQR